MISRVRLQRRSRRFCPSGVFKIVRRRSYSVHNGPIELAQGKDKDCCERGKSFLDDLLWFTYFLRYTFFLTVRVCYFGNVNDMLSYVYLPSVM